MKAIERLYEYLKNKGIRPTNFEREIGLSSGYLSVQRKRKADMGESILTKVSDNCQDLSMEWLLTGEGAMLKSQPSNSSGNVVVSNDFKGGTNHIGDISISNGIETSPLSAKEGQDAGDQSIRDRQHLIAEIERLKSLLRTQESMIEWLKQKYDEEAAHNRSLVNELLGKSKA